MKRTKKSQDEGYMEETKEKAKNPPIGIPSHFIWVEDRIWELKKLSRDSKKLIAKNQSQEIGKEKSIFYLGLSEMIRQF